MKTLMWVAFGSALGGAARYAAGLALPTGSDSRLPWSTLAVNIVGAFLIGLVAAGSGPDGRWVMNENFRLFLMVGVLGGFTTFSAYSLQTLDLLQSGQLERAAVYALGSVLVCLISVWAGYWIAK
ncbi:MAG: fluoride efflux transporter CrcB [Lysobacterales bacterium]